MTSLRVCLQNYGLYHSRKMPNKTNAHYIIPTVLLDLECGFNVYYEAYHRVNQFIQEHWIFSLSNFQHFTLQNTINKPGCIFHS